jgi:hypothetical protein
MAQRARTLATATATAAPSRGMGWTVVGLCALLMTDASQAQDELSQPLQAPQESVWLAASDHTLSQLRGGFDLGAGLVVSFGISRAVYINGQLITSTSLQVGDLSRLTPTQAAALGQQIATQTQVVQNGPGNTLESGTDKVPLTTFIQNTLNNQTIRNQTVIQATSNGLSMVKNMNLQSTINQAIANAIGNR